MRRSRLIGVSLAVGVIVLLGLPPFAMFASELAIARSLADARLTWALAVAHAADRGCLRRAGAQLGPHPARRLQRRRTGARRAATVAAALLLGVAASIALGITAGPLTDLFTAAAATSGQRLES